MMLKSFFTKNIGLKILALILAILFFILARGWLI